MERMEKWKVSIIHGYRYFGHVQNGRLSIGGRVHNFILLFNLKTHKINERASWERGYTLYLTTGSRLRGQRSRGLSPAMSTATNPARSERLWWYTSVGWVCCCRRRRRVMGRWFAALYDTVMAPLERGGFRDIRKQLLHQARGTVLEIGAGTGVN